MRILVVSNPHAAARPEDVERVCHALRTHGATVEQISLDTASALPRISAAMPDADMVMAIGGDGTIVHVAKCAALCGLPVVGVNGGRLGFLAALEINGIAALDALFDGSYTVEERLLLDVRSERAGVTALAMNEAVVSRGALSRLVEMTVRNGSDTMHYRADGIIVATPTGSTAYSLSAGGPVVDPRVPCLLLTPICPHSLYARSYVFAADTVLHIETAAPQGDTFLTVDGETELPLAAGETVQVRRSALTARLIRLKKQSFYDILEHKLIGRNGE